MRILGILWRKGVAVQKDPGIFISRILMRARKEQCKPVDAQIEKRFLTCRGNIHQGFVVCIPVSSLRGTFNRAETGVSDGRYTLQFVIKYECSLS